MNRLSLALLGAPIARRGDQTITFPTRKTLALLIYLAVEGGVHSREKLTDLFWPETDGKRGRAAFRRVLSDLRQALAGNVDYLYVAGDRIGFNHSALHDIDLQALDASVSAAHGATRAEQLARLQQALDIYRADFLSGFTLDGAPDFDDWASVQREYRHRQLGTVCEQLAQRQLDGGELGAAIHTLRRWLAHDPLNESAYRRLMLAHLAADDRTAALQAYEACRQALAKELKAKPSPEIVALAERVRAALPATRAQAPNPAAQAPAPPAWDALLVGRAREFEQVVGAFRIAQAQTAQAVSVEGEAGIGKTRLCADFLAWARAHGALILQGRAYEMGGRVPYQLLAHALRAIIPSLKSRLTDPRMRAALSDVWLGELTRLLPDLRAVWPVLPAPTIDETTAQARLFEAVARLVQALAMDAPVVLYLDDVQWADAATLDALHFAAARWADSKTRVLLLLSVRAETLATTPALSQWLAGLERGLPLRRIALGMLAQEGIGQWIASLASPVARASGGKTERQAPSSIEVFGRWLLAETGGQPFFIIETLKALLERGVLSATLTPDRVWAIDFDRAAGLPSNLPELTPAGVRELIRGRLQRLSPSAFGLLAAGAVLGHDFSFDQLCAVSGMAEDEGLPTLDLLLSNGLLQHAPDAPPAILAFGHDRIRDVCYTEAGDARRRVFHRRAFEHLQTARASAVLLAQHALAAGLMEAALSWSLVAGDDALGLFAVRDAITHYEAAHRLLAEHAADDISLTIVHDLYARLGRAYELSGAFADAQTVYQELLAFAQRSGAAHLEYVALNRLASVALQHTVDLDQATALLNRALDIAERSGEQRDLAETEWMLAQTALYAAHVPEARSHGERALAGARTQQAAELIARSLNVLALISSATMHWTDTQRFAEEARALYVASADRAMEADCLGMLALAQVAAGRPQAALASAREAHAISIEIDNSWGRVYSAIHLAAALLETGAYAEAFQAACEAVELARTHQLVPLLPPITLLLGCAQCALGDWEAARATHLAALAHNAEVPSQPFGAEIAAWLCEDCVLLGDWSAAHIYAHQVIDMRERSFHVYSGLGYWYQTAALLHAGEETLAVAEAQRFGEQSREGRRYRIAYLRARAVIAQSHRDHTGAIAYLHEASHIAESIGLPGEVWRIMAALAELHGAQGDGLLARQTLARAAEIVQSLAAGLQDEPVRAKFLSAASLASPLLSQ